jgi:uncharacterized protein (TIGR00290 family)
LNVVAAQRDGWSAHSWSGGKDSALALELAIEGGAQPGALLTMMDESGERSRSHGLPLAVLQAQAAALDLPLVTCNTTWESYTPAFVAALAQLADAGCSDCVFGDIDIDDHLRWCRDVCAQAGISARHPLWQSGRPELVEELLARGWTAFVVVVRRPLLAESILGRRFDRALVDELDAAGVDVCGENGEFHTVVGDGPLFSTPLCIEFGAGYAALDCFACSVSLSQDCRSPRLADHQLAQS